MLLYTSPAHGQQMEDAAIQKYIKILELEQFNRYSNTSSKKTFPTPRAKPQYTRVPKEKPAHPLTTYNDLYVYVVNPHNPNKKRIIECYSVGLDKYGYLIKSPCKEKK